MKNLDYISIVGIVVLVFVLRLYFLKISKANEKRILENGGVEYGVKNSKRITILHILFYAFSVIETLIRNPMFDSKSILGLALIIFSMFMLFTVTRLLKDIWTIKLMLLKDHKYVDHWLFRNVKHPNYYLNIIPELIGITLLCHSIFTPSIILPLYTIVLYIRISEEEKILKEIIIPNSK